MLKTLSVLSGENKVKYCVSTIAPPFPMLPPLTALNDRDTELLDALRIERFRATLAHELRGSTLYLSGLDRTLVISGGEEMTALLHQCLEIEREAWLTAAATNIHIYACNELIYRGSCNKLELKARGERMATAIQEQDVAQMDVANGIVEPQVSHVEESRIIRSMALADIAADLEADTSALQTFLEEHSATLIRFGETLLVLETDAASAYEHYSVIRARQKMQERFALNGAATEEKQSAKVTKTAPKESKPKKPTLTFKGKFQVNRSNYKRTIENFLDAMFPDNPADQKKALSDILQSNEIGGAYLEKIVRAGDYKDKQHAKNLLFKAAAELSKSSVDTHETEKEPEAVAD